MDNPLISIILPIHNEEQFVESTIKSILSQTFQDFELIIINDGSTDGTYKAISRYALNDNRIIIINNTKNLGIAKSLNKGIAISKGEYIARIDSGDIAAPSRFQEQLAYFKKHKDTYVVGTWAYLIDKERHIIGEWCFPLILNCNALYKNVGVIHPTVMIKRTLFNKIGIYDPDCIATEDFELWARTLKNKFTIRNIPKFLNYYLDEMNDAGGSISYKNYNAARLYLFKIKLKYLPIFFNIWNVIYTLRNLAGYFFPIFFGKNLAFKYMSVLGGKIYHKRKIINTGNSGGP